MSTDWQEECYQKVKSMKEKYFAELAEFHQTVSLLLPKKQPSMRASLYENWTFNMKMLGHMLAYLQMDKRRMSLHIQEKLPMLESKLAASLAFKRSDKWMYLMSNESLPGSNVGSVGDARVTDAVDRFGKATSQDTNGTINSFANNPTHEEPSMHPHRQQDELVAMLKHLVPLLEKQQQVQPQVLVVYEQLISMLQIVANLAEVHFLLQPQAKSSPLEIPTMPQAYDASLQPPNAKEDNPFMQQKIKQPEGLSNSDPICLPAQVPPMTQTCITIDEQQTRRKMELTENQKELADDEKSLNVLKLLAIEFEGRIKRRREVIADAEKEINQTKGVKRSKP